MSDDSGRLRKTGLVVVSMTVRPLRDMPTNAGPVRNVLRGILEEERGE